MQRQPKPRRQAAAWIFSVLLALAMLGGFGRLGDISAFAVPTDVGFRDFSFGTAVGSPTGNKAQSKLWFNDGTWWGSLFDPSANDYHIYRFDKANHSWTGTGTLIDRRNNSKADTLWDGNKLYVASAVVSATGTDQSAKVLRYSYDESAQTYTLDTGFPVTVGSGPMEAITLDKDTTGKLWVTFTQGGRVLVNRSQGSDTSWGQPFVPPVAGTNVDPDDISAVAAYDLRTAAPKMGLMWSNQLDDKVYFTAHTDGAADDAWQPTRTVIEGPKSADDHISLKSLQTDPEGRIFTVHKTSFGDTGTPDPNAPLILLTVLRQDGSFTRHVFGRVADDHTRPALITDEENHNLYVFATAPVSPGGTIYYKKTSLDAPNFPEGRGTPFIKSSTDTSINNVTSTKQNATSASGILMLASDDASNFYLHNTIDIEADTAPPTINLQTPPEGATYALNQTVNTAYTCADAGSGVQSCTGTAPNGAAIDTASPGQKNFTVTATDNAGNTSSTSHAYTVEDAPPAAQCSDGIDNDGDGKIDFGTGPSNDPGCQSATDNDEADAPTPKCTINGTAANNTINGTSRNDVICGFGGDDTLKGLGGNDTLLGHGGNDTLQGGSGNDTNRGSIGADTVAGGAGADRLFGDEDNDKLNSKDTVSGNDEVNGGTGTDRCTTDATEASITGCP
ncbi:hypothetical protein GBA63_11375 [Rubrobacter tropicus]|uniref:Calcium-binding protein n=1 Tax=Rubrobacter tropicus TaxID=2653851 RepID=A0A6G8Q9L7_9ACTN|nr:calcium-binding protein [Rubrobacter tropicus]QIN83175.1 hypothetical protein GBA63_11375 [Rubrobacter tropicus]